MTDYTELVAALRNNDWSDACPCCDEAMCKDADCIILQAADAIEALQAELIRICKQLPKRGKWIIHGEPPMLVIECSVCGQKYFNHVMQEKAKYCSMCGAKMDGEVEHG